MLWYIDGHHGMIGENAPMIPSLFLVSMVIIAFSYISTAKQHETILSYSELSSCSLTLQDISQVSWFQKNSFKTLKNATKEMFGFVFQIPARKSK